MRSSNKIKIEGGMSSMTDLVFLLLIFFIIISTFVNTSHQIQLPDGSGDPSLTSTVKVYVNAENQFFINSNEEPIQVSVVDREIMNLIGENKAIELLADKEFVVEHFAVQMVGDLMQSGKTLSNNQIYSLTKPWLLGGEYKIENIEPTDIDVHFSLTGQIAQQVGASES